MDKDELKKLPAQERIKKLKELVEQHEKEVEEAVNLIKDSEKEIKFKKADKEKSELLLNRLPELEQGRLGIPALEEALAEVNITREQEELARAQAIYDLTKETPTEYLRAAAEDLVRRGQLNQEQYATLKNIGNIAEQKLKDVHSGSYVPPEKSIIEDLSILAKIAKHTKLYQEK